MINALRLLLAAVIVTAAAVLVAAEGWPGWIAAAIGTATFPLALPR